jgi:Zn-finger nucleic acid-binding protein
MASNRSLSCLECGAQMDQRVEHGVTVDYCPQCGGVWLDPGELESLTGQTHHGHHSHDRDIDIDIGEEDEEEEEEGGLLGAVADALGGGEQEEGFEEEGFEEEEEW